MRPIVIIILVILLILLVSGGFFVAGKIKKIEKALPKTLYGEANKVFLQYPSVDWNTEGYDNSIAKFLFATAWNATSAKLTQRKIPVPSDFDVLVEIKPNFSTSSSLETYALFLHSTKLGISIISFGGSETSIDWITDITYDQISPQDMGLSDQNIRVHEGFYSVYVNLRNQLKQLVNQYYSGTLYLTGYSLGGGLCQIASLDFADNAELAAVYTFASPRAMNNSGSEYLTSVKNYFRFANSEDIVPDLPPPIITDIWTEKSLFFEQVGENITFTSNDLSVLANHSTAYRDYLGF